ncbi:hypothetical protein [Streptomyces sp. NPDC003036]|uniref:hypothetical protein n=1 Tax=Streptomyces sp. NPDC003036 TaxID=3154442 RepID=UPI0033B8BABD
MPLGPSRQEGRASAQRAQRILRHSQLAMTMEAYTEASDADVRDALGKLSEAMGGTG